MTNGSAPDLQALRVAFAGTPEFAAAALRAIHRAGAQIPCVLTQPDRPAGRGLKLMPSAVKQVALEAGLPVLQPAGLRLDGRHAAAAAEAEAALRAAAPDVWVVAAYGLILPPWALALPRLGCLNIHASLLPRWRGAAPIQRAIEAGDASTGITLMQMDSGLDTGDMVAAEALAIRPDDTAASLHDRLADLGARMVVEALQRALTGPLAATPQPAEGATYAAKIEKAEGEIDWADDAAAIERRIRAFDPFPGMRMQTPGGPLKVWRAALRGELSGAPGTVLQAGADRLCIACGRGAVDLLELQRPGGTRQPAGAVLAAAGIELIPGARI